MTKSRNIIKPRAIWTPDQLALCKKLYPHNKTEKIAPQIDKTAVQVFSKAAWLCLKKTA